ncbi:S46 family peptidase [Allomuricauda sp. SCSIO 65647]|uniref:S46 family peptidase n=1 Tax=Allomuricauda sp. SCSIO 65647 TaxID=2908843 RepID=UPI001F311AB8|nr:S46 family peptidase [Muricauda sp. SCSIO 65647]UJH68404.1 S46 family peptidase [Muricauda sp. SCSIO 65647]
MKIIKFLLASSFLLISSIGLAQDAQPNRFDFGKMWSFENPPKEWFKEAYNFEPGDDWFTDVRKSSLRFAEWCSASFISPNGLIMTNHHCSRSVVGALQQENENFDTQGFYAVNQSDERKAEGLFVEQLHMIADITDEVMALTKNPDNDLHKAQMTEDALKKISEEYGKKEAWSGLRLEPVTYYSGGKFSLYGYKKYEDIRLVWIPELDLGFYGGDPDNFTYPRYNLDATFWRAYDENGNPVDSSKNYFKFNPNGASENEVTFVVGNPGSTERYRTISQLEYDRDYRYPMILRFLENRHQIMMEEYKALKSDPSKELEAQEKLNDAFSFSNSIKAIGGIIDGLKNPELFERKVAMEKHIRSKSADLDYWDNLATAYKKLLPHSWAVMHLGASPYRGKALMLMHQMYNFENMVAEEISEDEMTKIKSGILELAKELDTPKERRLLNVVLSELEADIYQGDNTVTKLLAGKSIDAFVDDFFGSTVFKDESKVESILSEPKNLADNTDVLMQTARVLISKYNDAALEFESSSPYRRGLESKIANQVFNVYGAGLPPDATFTLRISDGVVKGYEYNGTEAPYKTTYYGLYNRHFSNDKEFPWALPERWKNPPTEFLQYPINFVSTNDIIGGNSGSPIINKNKEVVGLVFDGNIESLPSNFIFDEEYNRTVSVHSGGIYGALKYIYKTDRLLDELTK